MAKLLDRCKVTTATTGTGTITLGSAVSGFQTFANAGAVNGDSIRYVIEDGTGWEIGTGVYTATGTTLSRSVLKSSNSNAALSLTGSAVVFSSVTALDLSAGENVYIASIGNGSATQFTLTHNLNTRDVVVDVYRNSGNFDDVLVEKERLTDNTVRITITPAPALNSFRAIVWNPAIIIGGNATPLTAEGTDSWMAGKAPAIINRGTPRFLTPEMYIGLSTQIVYMPETTGGTPPSYAGATDFAAAFAAMRDEMLLNLSTEEWWFGGTTTYDVKGADFGVAFQPGHRYRVASGINWTGFRTPGLHIYGNGARIYADYAGGDAVVDMINSRGIFLHDLNISNDSNKQPPFAVLFGRRGNSTTVDWAGDIKLLNVQAVGWFTKAAGYNHASEVNQQIGCYWENYSGTGPAFWLDQRNAVGIQDYTQADGVTATTEGANHSCVMHTFDHCQFRTLTSNPMGALRISSSLTESNVLGCDEIYLRNVYFTATGSDTAFHPAITVEGKVSGLTVEGHAETGAAGATYQLSHFVYYDTENWSTGTLRQHHHKILSTGYSFAEAAQIGQSAAATAIVFEDADFSIIKQIGTNLVGGAAPMFGANMTNSKVSGKLSVADADLLNITALGGFMGDIYADFAVTSLGLPAAPSASLANFHGRMIRPSGITNFPTGLWNPTFTSVSNLDSTPTGANWRYWVDGRRVHFMGSITVDPTANAQTQARFTLPITTTFADASELQGGGNSASLTLSPLVRGDTATGEGIIIWISGTTSSVGMTIWGSYTLDA